MKYYSDKLGKLFDTPEQCDEAEKTHDKAIAEAEAKKKALADERATRAKEVEEAYKKAVEAKKAYDKILQDFLNDYHTFHATFKTTDPFFSFLDWF